MNPQSVVIRFNSNGSVKCLWTEAIDLSKIGTLKRYRASQIEPDDRRGVWTVKVKGRILFSHPSRNACLDFEHRELNKQLLKGSA